jgi:hypothetical protein
MLNAAVTSTARFPPFYPMGSRFLVAGMLLRAATNSSARGFGICDVHVIPYAA